MHICERMKIFIDPARNSWKQACYSKNSNNRIGFRLTCTANSLLLLNMKRVVE
ncbi:hypothetical protein F383_31282 [Gossypium arboreum]|uniref:Uncharacterized protein n=1 Tax=Gossypium arboreum TaxID=29729 RepID=A0A0B0PMC3_GOSAR|nr:hypothetical protein F383_31282 [Gossypium arboreum]